MKLPNGVDAIVELRKLTEYCLNPLHKLGGHKAEVFRRVLGCTHADATELRAALLYAAAHIDVASSSKGAFGWYFILDFPMSRNGRQAWLRSGWIIAHGELRPRLTTCFIRRKGKQTDDTD